jgi:hypothetical protein
LSASIRARNSSGADLVAGTQTSTVLYSVPASLTTLSATDMLNAISDKERDSVSNIASKDENTVTLSLSEHFGAKMGLTRDNTQGNLVKRSVSINSMTSSSQSSVPASAALRIGVVGKYANGPLAVAGGMGSWFFDSSQDPVNVCTFATYNVEFSFNCRVSSTLTGGVVIEEFIDLMAVALDAADNVLDARLVPVSELVIQHVAEGYGIQIPLMGLSSSTTPIARFGLFHRGSDPDGTLTVISSSAFLVGIEETSDIAMRPVHATVFEGINPSATLSLQMANVICGVPDSNNAFISGGGTADDALVDNNLVDMYLRSWGEGLQHAYTETGRGIAVGVNARWASEDIPATFQAASGFGNVKKAMKKLGSKAKRLAKDGIPIVADMAEPFVSAALTTYTGAPPGTGGVLMDAATKAALNY